MSFEFNVPEPPPSGEPTEPQMCEVCFSSSHSTENCDVVREGVMLKNMAWVERIANGNGLRTERIEQVEGVTVYRIRTEDGTELGRLEIADEPRAMQPEGSKVGSVWGALSFHFESPAGFSFKTGPRGAFPHIEDILVNGIDFLKEAHEQEIAEQKAHVRDEFGKLELDGSHWKMSIPGFENMSSVERAAALGLTPVEFRESEHIEMDYGSLWSELRTGSAQNDLHRLWEAWKNGSENVAELEEKVRAPLKPPYLAMLDRVKEFAPKSRELQEKTETYRDKEEEHSLGISREEIDFIGQTVDDENNLLFALRREDQRARLREWWRRSANPPEVAIPQFDTERDRLGLESVSDEELERQLFEKADDSVKSTLQALKDRLPRYMSIKEKMMQSTQ